MQYIIFGNKMNRTNKIIRYCKGLTLLEMFIALALLIVVMTSLLPQIASINKGWDSRIHSSNALQNGRVLVEHLNRNLTSATKIIAVSESTENAGYIEFQDNNGDIQRYEISPKYMVQFGNPGVLQDLAGPIGKFNIKCYDDNDLDTPIDIDTYGVDGIRFIKTSLILTNAAELGQDKDLTASAYLRTNPAIVDPLSGITPGPINPMAVDIGPKYIPAIYRIDETHYLGSNGYEDDYVFYADPDTGKITLLSKYRHIGDRRLMPAFCKIDDDHVLKVSCRGMFPGYACVLTINADWTITEEPGLEYDSDKGHWASLAKIDDDNYLCIYSGSGSDGFAIVLTIDSSDWSIKSGPKLEFDKSLGECTSIAKIDDWHYLCLYKDTGGYAFVMTVDPGTYALTANPIVKSYSAILTLGRSDVYAIDTNHYIVNYSPNAWPPRNEVVLLRVNTADWTIDATEPTIISKDGIKNSGMGQYSATDYVVITSNYSSINAVEVSVDTSTWTVSTEAPVVIDPSDNITDDPAVTQINGKNVICIYPGGSGFNAIIIRIANVLYP